MKKTLVTLAAVAASTGAFAQSSVTLYGKVDASVVNVNKVNAAGQSITAMTGSNSDSAVWGLRGSEDLGGGMKAVFNVEGDINPQDGTASAAGMWRRASWAGLSGGFGEVSFGLRLNPLILAVVQTNAQYNNSVLASGTLAGNWADFFTKNAITYTSPSMGGLTVQGQYGFGNAAGTSNGDMYALNATYAAGPLSLTGAMQSRKAGGGTDSASAADKDTWLLGGTYTIGAAKLALMAFENKYSATAGGAKTKYSGWSLTGVYNISTATNVAGAVWDTEGARLYNLRANYVLSKRTSLYAMYNKADNSTSGTAVTYRTFWSGTSTGTNTPGVAGTSTNGVALGVIHAF